MLAGVPFAFTLRFDAGAIDNWFSRDADLAVLRYGGLTFKAALLAAALLKSGTRLVEPNQMIQQITAPSPEHVVWPEWVKVQKSTFRRRQRV